MKRFVLLFLAILLCVTVNAFAADVSSLMASLNSAKKAVDSTLFTIDSFCCAGTFLVIGCASLSVCFVTDAMRAPSGKLFISKFILKIIPL